MSDLSLARNPHFQRLVAATASNELSTAMSSVMVPLLLLTFGGSATMAGLGTFLFMLTSVGAQTFAGAVVDRLSGGVAFRWASALQAGCWAGLALAVFVGQHAVLWIIVLSSLAGVFSSMPYPSEQTLIKSIVPQKQFGQAAAVSQGREAVAGLVGGPLGGALLGLSASVALLVQVVLHLAAWILVPSVLRSSENSSASEGSSLGSDVLAGFRLVWNNRSLRSITLVAALVNLPIAALPLALIAYYERAGYSALLIGVFASSLGLGAVLGSLAAGRVTSRFRLGPLGIVALLIYAVMTSLLVAVHPVFVATCLCCVVAGLPLPAFNSAIAALTIAVTSEENVGKVVASTGVPGMILMPLGTLFAGWGFDNLGIVWTLGVVALLMVPPLLLSLVDDAFRGIPKLSELGVNDPRLRDST